MSHIFLPPSLRTFQPKYVTFSAWLPHQPFGYDLVTAIRPKLTVELGTQMGLSYFTFCQAMMDAQIDGLAYAVDTWEGDKHTTAYGEEIYNAVVAQNARYNHFSYLMRMYFAEALTHFADGTIDLLHIDGLHTYEAVKEDFETWSPKVRPGGIILFHDIRARLMDFGVWKFWDELERDHETFAFDQGHGLGVLRMPGGDRSDDPELIRHLFEGAKADGGASLRALYVLAQHCLDDRRKVERMQAKRAEKLKEGRARETLAGAQAAPGSATAD